MTDINTVEQWISVAAILAAPGLPSAAVDAALESELTSVLTSVGYGDLRLNPAQATRLLELYHTSEDYEGLEQAFAAAAAQALSPDELGEVLAGLPYKWRMVAAAMPYLDTGPIMHYLSLFGLRSEVIAQTGLRTGHFLPQAVLRRSTSDSESVPGLRKFWTMVSPGVDPELRAEALLEGLADLRYISMDDQLYAYVHTLRDPAVVEAVIDRIDDVFVADQNPHYVLQYVVMGFPIPQVRDLMSELALRIISKLEETSVREFFAAAHNYGLHTEVRDALRPLARMLPDLKRPDFVPVSGEKGLQHLGELAARGTRIEVSSDFADHRRPTKSGVLYFDSRWPRHHRNVVALADEMVIRQPNEPTATYVNLENLLPVVDELVVERSWLRFGVADTRQATFLNRALSRRGVQRLDCGPFTPVAGYANQVPAELAAELYERLGTDQSRWANFFGLMAQGLLPSEAVVVAV